MNTSENPPGSHKKRPLSIIEETDDDGLDNGILETTIIKEENHVQATSVTPPPVEKVVEVVRSPSFKAIKQFFVEKTEGRVSGKSTIRGANNSGPAPVNKRLENKKNSINGRVSSPHTKTPVTKSKSFPSSSSSSSSSQSNSKTTSASSSNHTQQSSISSSVPHPTKQTLLSDRAHRPSTKPQNTIRTTSSPSLKSQQATTNHHHLHSKLSSSSSISSSKPPIKPRSTVSSSGSSSTASHRDQANMNAVPNSSTTDKRNFSKTSHQAPPKLGRGQYVDKANKKSVTSKRESSKTDSKLSSKVERKDKETVKNRPLSDPSISQIVSQNKETISQPTCVQSDSLLQESDSSSIQSQLEKDDKLQPISLLAEIRPEIVPTTEQHLPQNSPNTTSLSQQNILETNNQHQKYSNTPDTQPQQMSTVLHEEHVMVILHTESELLSQDVTQLASQDDTQLTSQNMTHSVSHDTLKSVTTDAEETESRIVSPASGMSSSNELFPSIESPSDSNQNSVSVTTSTTPTSSIIEKCSSARPSSSPSSSSSSPSAAAASPDQSEDKSPTVHKSVEVVDESQEEKVIEINNNDVQKIVENMTIQTPLLLSIPTTPPSSLLPPSPSSLSPSSLSPSMQLQTARSPKILQKLRPSPIMTRKYSIDRTKMTTVNGKLITLPSAFQSLPRNFYKDQNSVDSNNDENKNYGHTLDTSRYSGRTLVPGSPLMSSMYRTGRRGSYFFKRKQSTDSLNSESEPFENSDEVTPLSPADLNRLKETAERMHLTTRRPSILQWRQNYVDETGLPRIAPILSVRDGDATDDNLTSERKQRINDALDWLRNELQDMRMHDQALARQLLTIRQEIHQLKLQRCTEEHQNLLDDFKSELEELEEFSDVLDLPHPIYEDNPLKHIGITRHNMSARRFSAC